jgi:hypothetical protein
MLSIGTGFGCKHDGGDTLGQNLEHPQGIQAYLHSYCLVCSLLVVLILLIQLKLLNMQLLINPSSP